MSTTVTYTDVLKDIQDFYVETSVDAYVPTLNTTIKFKPLSVSQMKKFIELQVNASKDETGIVASLDMVNDLNSCLVENCLTKESNSLLQKLTIIDRDAVIAQLRAANSPNLEIPGEEGEEPQQVSIEHLIGHVKESKLPNNCKKRQKVFKFETGQITLKMRLPTLQHDSYINTYFKSQVGPYIRQGQKKIQQNLDKILSQTYFVELCKYIELLEIEKDGRSTLVAFDNVETMTQQLKLLEGLPTDIVRELSGYVKDLKEYKENTLFYVDSDGQQKPLSVDVNLFISI